MFLLAKLKILFVFLSLFSPLQLLLYPPLTGELSRGNPPSSSFLLNLLQNSFQECGPKRGDTPFSEQNFSQL